MITGIDWFIIIVLALSSLIGLKRGLIKEALSLVIWIIAFIIASSFSPHVAPLLAAYIPSVSLQQMAAFALLLIGVLVAGGVINHLLSALVKFKGLSGTDRLLGMLFGVVRGAIIIMLVVVYMPQVLPVQQEPWWQESLLVPYFIQYQDLFHSLRSSLFQLISGFFS